MAREKQPAKPLFIQSLLSPTEQSTDEMRMCLTKQKHNSFMFIASTIMNLTKVATYLLKEASLQSRADTSRSAHSLILPVLFSVGDGR